MMKELLDVCTAFVTLLILLEKLIPAVVRHLPSRLEVLNWINEWSMRKPRSEESLSVLELMFIVCCRRQYGVVRGTIRYYVGNIVRKRSYIYCCNCKSLFLLSSLS